MIFDERPDIELLFRLADAQGKTVRSLVTGRDGPLSAFEFDLWAQYKAKIGLWTDRLEAVVANAGSAVCFSNGARTHASAIIPKWVFPDTDPRNTLYALACMPGATVTFTPFDKSAPVLTGVDALSMLDRPEKTDPNRRKTLDGGPPDPKKANRPRTLSGD